MSTPRRKRLVGTLWFEASGASRYAACRQLSTTSGRVRLKNYASGTIQMDVSGDLFSTLLARGYVRPIDEVPTLPRGRLRKIDPETL